MISAPLSPKLIRELVTGAVQSDVKSLWSNALFALGDAINASGISLATLTPEGPIHLQAGALAPVAATYIARWEQRLPLERSPAHSDMYLYHEGDGFVALHVPVSRADGLYGALSIVFEDDVGLPTEVRKQYECFSEDVQALAAIFDLVSEFRLTSRRLQQVSLFYQVGQDITSTLDHIKVLEKTTALAQQVLEADASTLFLIDHEREELVFTIPYGEKEGVLREMRMPISQGVVGWVATHKKPVTINDVNNDPRFAASVDEQTGFVTRSILCVPLQYHGRTVGVLEVLNKRGDQVFNEEDEEWLMALGAQAAIAIENARLVEALRVESERIVETQERVRNQLARDLHDGPAQVLLALIQNIGVARHRLQREPESIAAELDLLDELAREAHHQMRQQLFELRPIILEHRGLVAAIETFLEQQAKIWSYKVEFEVDLTQEDFDVTAASAIFMIVQEALNNARKHANAQHVYLRLRQENTQLRFEIEDDGNGVNLAEVGNAENSRVRYGLVNMRERAHLLDGELHILSPRPEGRPGTLVTGWVPLHRLRATNHTHEQTKAGARQNHASMVKL